MEQLLKKYSGLAVAYTVCVFVVQGILAKVFGFESMERVAIGFLTTWPLLAAGLWHIERPAEDNQPST